MMKGVWAVVRMSFLTYFRDRSSVFWGILFPLLLMGLIGTVFGEASVQFDVAVVRQAEEAGWFSDWFVETLDQIEVFTVWEEASLDEALAALAEQRASLVVALPTGAWPDRPGTAGSGPQTITVYHRPGSQVADLGVSIIRDVVTRLEQGISGRPALMTVEVQEAGGSPGFDMFDYLLPGIIAMTLMQTGLMGVTWVVANYREQKLLKRVLATPFPPGGFLVGLIGRFTARNLMEVTIIFLVGTYVFGAQTRGDLVQYFLICLLGSVAFLAMGMAISTLSPTAEAANNLGNVIGFPMMFLSGVFWPREMMPEALRPVLDRLPLAHLVDALRGVAEGTGTLVDYAGELTALLLWTVVGIGVAAWRFRWE